jgi:hypothetical protein
MAITGKGLSQSELVNWMDKIDTLIDELRTDHASFKTLTDETKDDCDAIAAAVDAILQKLDADAGITDTDYEAVHGVGGSGTALPAAAITAADVATITAAAVGVDIDSTGTKAP